MYARGLSTRQISDTIEELYGFEVSDTFFLPQIHQWQSRPLVAVYSVVFIDATHYSVRDNGTVKKLAAYVILAINLDGRKEVLNIEIGENESTKYWLGVLNALKNRGLKDILIFFRRRCIVGQKYTQIVLSKDRKEFAADLKKIYTAQSRLLSKFATKFPKSGQKKYPHSMKSWSANWDATDFQIFSDVAYRHVYD